MSTGDVSVAEPVKVLGTLAFNCLHFEKNSEARAVLTSEETCVYFHPK